MSNTSIPCIFPKSSNRSNPVLWSRSVGTVPGSAPGGRRSASVLISARGCIGSVQPDIQSQSYHLRKRQKVGSCRNGKVRVDTRIIAELLAEKGIEWFCTVKWDHFGIRISGLWITAFRICGICSRVSIAFGLLRCLQSRKQLTACD